jgi:diguanylate cyclase (GGDEF)-like protein/PAS domain S-box-containing protein
VSSKTISKPEIFRRMLMVLIAYYAAGMLGLLIPYVGSHITLIWLPTGIAVAALVRWGYHPAYLLAIYLASLVVNYSVGSSVPLSAQIAVGNTLAPLVAALIMQRFNFQNALDRPHDILLLVIAAMMGMIFSATGGVLSLMMAGTLAGAESLKAWMVWWLGDTVGVLLVAPMLLSISQNELRQLWRSRTQLLTWIVIVGLLEWLIFQYVAGPAGQYMLLSFVLLPLVVWAAIRYGITGASIVILGLSIIAVWSTANQHSLFYHSDMHQSVFSLWVFMATMVLVALMITILQSRHRLSERALRESESKLRGMINGALDAIVTIDHQGNIVEFNPAAESIFGYQRAVVLGRRLAEVLIPPGMRDAHLLGHQKFIESGNKKMFDRRVELTAMRADGTEFPVELTLTTLQDTDLPLVTGFIRDITDKKRAEEDIRHLAFFDALTGLPNRRLLIDRLQQAFASSARAQKYGAVMFIDLDNFKTLNDSRGHDYGDLLLIDVAQRLRACVRAEDTVARLSGDEFVIILEDLSANVEQSVIEARNVGEKILDIIHKPYYLREIEYHNTCSVGISLFIGGQISVDELLKRSDTAMYQAKAAGRDTLKFYDPQMQEALERRIELEAFLRVALLKDQFMMLYQPQVTESREIFAAEVLLRWDSPQHGMLSPTQFIAIAEETGLIIAVGHWVLLKACQQLKIWEQCEQTKNIELAVNVSARQFRQSGFVDEIKQIFHTTGARPEMLKLELTESVVLDNVQEAIQKMEELRAMGVRFAMDDFGTGYSSLAYLKQLPLAQVKIDQSFVRDIATDVNDAAIIQTIIAMSKTLKLSVIAEGVETEAQFEMLRQYGCSQFQGYLFGRPMLIKEFDALLGRDALSFPCDSSENSVCT